jgi:fibro-slime domain-containing protein
MAADDGSGKCGNILRAVVRDFKGKSLGGHPDFEAELYGNDITPKLVQAILGADHKPVYVPICEQGTAQQNAQCPFGAETTTKANFDQWYRFTPDVNKPHVVKLWFAPQAGGLFTFQSLYFFPIDGGGWMDTATADDGKPHNFSFTTELHTKFQYAGGETFTFDGDDDVWVFVNGKLAVDVGGLHPAKSGSVSLDASATALQITPGSVYTLDLFHAERHTPASTFRIDTNLSFVDCGSLPDDVVK